MDKNIIDTFINLTECKLTEAEWLNWFDNNKALIETTCGRTAFLKIKPKESFSDSRNTCIGQVAVFEWLKTKNINVTLGDTYKKAYLKEVDEVYKQQKQKDKERQKQVKENFGYLENFYPKFFKQLQKSLDTSNTIGKGKSQLEISEKEQNLSITFSADLKTFFLNISKLKLEGIEIEFGNISLDTFNNKQFLVLGEFWCYGDGDKLLYDLTTANIFSFAHEYRPPEIIELSKTMTELLEKTFTKYLKQATE